MDRYSRLVAWLKVLLPLIALGLLSTLFLLSRNVDPYASIPFADSEIQERLKDEQITSPFFSGSNEQGDRLTFFAEKLVSAGVGSGNNRAEDLTAKINLASGARIVAEARSGIFDFRGGQSTLDGDVVVTLSTGYRVTSDRLDADTSRMVLSSPGPVEATGPFGVLSAGAMSYRVPEDADTAHLIFTNGVKLIYDPKQPDE